MSIHEYEVEAGGPIIELFSSEGYLAHTVTVNSDA